jgi:hypothetical protein
MYNKKIKREAYLQTTEILLTRLNLVSTRYQIRCCFYTMTTNSYILGMPLALLVFSFYFPVCKLSGLFKTQFTRNPLLAGLCFSSLRKEEFEK